MADLSLKYLLFGEDRTASKAIKGVADTAEDSAGRFSGASKAWQAGAALAGAAVVKMGYDTVQAASDQNEVVSKSSVIFGDNAGEILSWASTADKSMGLSKTAALNAASGFGDMFLQLGFAGDQAAKMSQKVVGLSADLGSFNNLPTAEVADMMSAAFRGEYDSLQRLVPNINAARVETEALATTGKKNASELTAQEKAAATLAIVTRDSARAQGDFARTSDGAANSQKILTAEFENQQAALGQKLLPVWSQLLSFGSTSIGVFGSVVDEVSSLPAPTLATAAAFVAWRLAGDRVEGMAGRVAGTVRPMGESIRLAGMYARDAGGGMTGLRAGLGALSGGLGAGQTAMRGFSAAGSAVMGLAGGPWGLAIMGLTMAVTGFIQSQKNAEAAAKSLAETMERQTGTFTDASRKTVVEAIMGDLSPEDIKLLQDLGVSLSEGADAAIAGGPALDAYRAKIEHLTENNRDAWSASEGYRSSLENQNEVVQKAKTVNEVLAREGIKPVAEAADEAADSGDLFAGVVDAVGSAASGAKVDMQGVNDELAEFHKVTMSARGAARDYEAAVDDASAAVKENGRTLNINTEAGRKNQAALDRIAESALDVAEADIKAGKSTGDVTTKVLKANDAFVAAAVKMGMKEGKARKLAGQLGLTSGKVQELTNKVNGVPAAKTTTVTVPTATAKRQAQTIRDEIRDIRGKNVPVTIRVFGLGPLRAAEGLLAGISGVARSVFAGENAHGTASWRGGLTWVGERGPELVDLPGGTQIYDANTSRSMAGSGSGSGGGSAQPLVVQLVLDGRVIQTSLLKLRRQSGGSLGFD